MKEENQNGKERQMAEEQIDFRTLLFKYIIHWPWFVGAVLLCFVGAWFYLHWATPIYNISATVLIKDEKKGGGSGVSSELEDMGLSGLMTSSKNIDNELEVLRSKTLVKEVVNQLNLYITYKDEDEFPAKGLYKTSPVQVSLTPQEAEKLKTSMVVEMTLQPEGSMDVNVTVGEKGYQKHFEKLPAIFPTDEGTLAFFQDVDSVTLQDGTKVPRLEKNVRHITATINKPMRVAKGYCNSLSIAPTSKTTSVAVISLKNSSLQCGQDFINQLLEMYNRNTNNDKNEIAKDEKYNLIEAAKLLGSNKYYMMICVTYILQQIYTAMIGMGTYYAIYIFGNENLFGVFSWAINIPLILALIFTPILVAKWHGMYKLNVMSYGLATISRALVAVAGFMGASGNVGLMLLFTAIAALGQGPWQGDMNAVIAACSEYTWLTKHKRVDGTMYSCTSLGVKLGGGIGTAITGWLLAASAFDRALAVQPDSCINMLKIMYLIIPFVLDAIITFILSRMKVEEANEKLRTELNH